ncbi:hypothetical protein BJY00DRAFT_276819 [Aspergillus carlsbadensis]|nr:hypothetical protein BJY00DRAFT_276819 [Aspergillus carlsbadensis]
MEDLQARHRKEQKDLQARITQKKKSATKKTRRGINEECDRLQRELTDRHHVEVAGLNGETSELPVDGLEDISINYEAPNRVTEALENGVDEEPTTAESPVSSTTSPTSNSTSTTSTPLTHTKKPNRQKARLARRAAEQAAQAAQAEEEASKLTNHRGNEKEAMEAVFKRLKLKEVDINPDGHCLFSAVACQLDEMGLGLKPDPGRIVLQSPTLSRMETVASPRHDGYRAVRAVAADFIIEHKDDFEAFMEEPLEQYTRKIRLTAEWGGQLELQAIARAYGVTINVIQGDGRIEKIESGDADEIEDEEERKKRVIWLAYYRHTYGLGEHYNALTTQV